MSHPISHPTGKGTIGINVEREEKFWQHEKNVWNTGCCFNLEHKFNLFVYLKNFEVIENMYSATVDILTISAAILLTAVTVT